MFISFAPTFTDSQIMLDDTADDCLVELIRDLGPRYFSTQMCKRISAACRKFCKYMIAISLSFLSMNCQFFPKCTLSERIEPVIFKKRLTNVWFKKGGVGGKRGHACLNS